MQPRAPPGAYASSSRPSFSSFDRFNAIAKVASMVVESMKHTTREESYEKESDMEASISAPVYSRAPQGGSLSPPDTPSSYTSSNEIQPYDLPPYQPHMPPLERDTMTVLACWKWMGGTQASLKKKHKDPVWLWKGVTVENGRVVKLDWQRKQLRNSIPPLFCDLTALKQLALSGNSLEGSIPSELGRLTNLISLSLSKNELSGSVPRELAKMRKLKYLYLNNNRWDPNGNVHKQRFDKLAATQNFLGSLLGPSAPVRSSTPVVVTPNSTLSEDAATVLECWRAMGGYEPLLTNAKTDVSKWKGVTVEDVTGEGHYRVVKVDWHLKSLCHEIPVEITALAFLTSLSLSYNNLTGNIPAKLGDMENLVSLGLASNQLRGKIPSSLSKLHNLKYLNLCMNDFDCPVPIRLQNRGPTQDFLNMLVKRDRKRDKPDIPELDDTAPVRKIPARENRTNVSFRGKGHPLDKGKALGLGNSLFM